MRKKTMVITILIIPVLIHCSCTRALSLDNSRRLYKNIPADGRYIHYLSGKYTRDQYNKKKKTELLALQYDLKQKYNLSFRVRHSKYFNIAYRCSNERINHLQDYLVKFFKQIYPRYFKYEPGHPIRVVYFKDRKNYRKYTRSGAYGYYTYADKTLTTYSNSGHGTLWHELIHAFVDQNLESNPQQWFSEGFASFYEMAFLHNGRVVDGYTNWRMPLLHRSMKKSGFSHLSKFLLHQSMREEFGYAKARFLFCYLWVHKKMAPFVKAYLYELGPRYSGRKLGEMSIKKIEELLGRDINTIHREYMAMARKLKKNQKLSRK